MRRIGVLLLFSSLLIGVLGCSGAPRIEFIRADPCAQVGCSDHGQCRVSNGQSLCLCDEGYRASADGQDCLLNDWSDGDTDTSVEQDLTDGPPFDSDFAESSDAESEGSERTDSESRESADEEESDAETTVELGHIVQMAAGDNFTCALNEHGAVFCFGDNTEGELGNGHTKHSRIPVLTSGLSSETRSLVAGSSHVCAIHSGVVCWGSNQYSQLGSRQSKRCGVFPVVDDSCSMVPIPAAITPDGIEEIALAARDNHSCAVLVGGEVLCWGANSYGQIGNTSIGRALDLPTRVLGLPGKAKGVAAGSHHSCALLESGEVYCWGANGNGELGDGSIAPVDRRTPVRVSRAENDFQSIVAGSMHTCAITTKSAVYCWGDYTHGQLGSAGIGGSRSTTPVQVNGLTSGVVELSAGFYHTCARFESGAVKCWGDNTQNQLGTPTYNTCETGICSYTPVFAPGMEYDMTAIAAGQTHTCAAHKSGILRCWGGPYGASPGDLNW